MLHRSRYEPPQRRESVGGTLHGRAILLLAVLVLNIHLHLLLPRGHGRRLFLDGTKLRKTHAEALHLTSHETLLLPQRARRALQRLVPDLARGLGLAGADLVGGERGQGVGQRGEAGRGLGLAVLLAALEVLALGRGLVGGLGDAGHEGRVLDEALVALGLDEGVVDLGGGAVQFTWGEWVGEALCCFCAEGLALCRGCWGLWLLWLILPGNSESFQGSSECLPC